MKKKPTLFLVLGLIIVSVHAQNNGERYVTNGFWDNWFISAGGGSNIYFAKENNRLDFNDRITPALDFSVGKWILPVLGVRMQYAGLSAKGTGYGITSFAGDNALPGQFNKIDFNLLHLHADAMLNISDLFGRYRADRRWEFIPFAGVGWARAYDSDGNSNEVAVSLGLLNKILLNDRWDLNLEMRTMAVNQRFDMVMGGRVDALASLSVGVSYKIKNRSFQTVRYCDFPSAAGHGHEDYEQTYEARIAGLERLVNDHNSSIQSLTDQLELERQLKNRALNDLRELESLIVTTVFFPIGQSALHEQDLVELKYMAEIIKKTGNKYVIKGHADSVTGSERRNRQLSEHRANAVYDVLVNRFGVLTDQLSISPEGQNNEPYHQPNLNRVARIYLDK